MLLWGPESCVFPGLYLCLLNFPSPWQPADNQQDHTLWWPEHDSWLQLSTELHHLGRKEQKHAFFFFEMHMLIIITSLILVRWKRRTNIVFLNAMWRYIMPLLNQIELNILKLHTHTISSAQLTDIYLLHSIFHCNTRVRDSLHKRVKVAHHHS